MRGRTGRVATGIGRAVALGLLLATGLGVAGCQTFREIAALEQVDFLLDGVSDVELAGVGLDGVRSYGDLGAGDVVRVLAAVSQGELPLRVRLNVLAENPGTNAVSARLVRLDWILLLEGRETVTGSIADAVSLPPGEPQLIPIDAGLDLLRFFNESGPDLVELVLALTGQSGGAPKEIAIRARPTIDTPLGPMTYPNAVTIVRRDVGGS